MIYMSKLFNITSKITFAILSFFFFSLSVSAANVKAHVYECSSGHDLYTTTYRLKGVDGDRKIGCVGVISVDSKTHAYCIEPGVKMQSGYNSSSTAFTSYSTNFFSNASSASNKRKMVQQILSFAVNLTGTNFDNTSAANRYKAYAAQGMIWEVIVGERTSFGVNDPSTATNDFYSVIHSSSNSSKTGITAIKNEYDALLSKLRATYAVSQLGEKKNGQNNIFNFSAASANKVPLICSSTGCSLTINDSDADFKYWKIKSTDGLTVTKNAAGNAITISTNESISSSTPKTIELDVDGTKGTAYAYADSERQDVVTVAGLSQSAYLKVYTPKYQLKVVKKSSSDISQLNNLNLSGAKFNVCSDSACSKKLTTITTDKDGVATYTDISMPGTYYVKEITAPSGYEANTSVKAVSVSSSNISGSSSFGTVPITNTAKIFNLTKKTIDEEGNVVILEDGCGTNAYTGPEFEIIENGKSLYFKEVSPGNYVPTLENEDGATTKIKTCQGKFNVHTLPKCNYIIAETKAPEGLTLPSEPTKEVNICGEDKNVSFTNGFAGLEFQKKNEDGELISGGKFALQMKVNNIYKDVLLKEIYEGNYVYDANLKENDEDAKYIILTDEGILYITKLPPGEYRIVEKEAPEGYEFIADKDSTAKITIKDSDKDGYYLTELINQKVNKKGSEDSAELIVTITTGRKVPNYVVIISILTGLLIAAIILRKKFKK